MRPHLPGARAMIAATCALIASACANGAGQATSASAADACNTPEEIKAAFMYGFGVYEFARTRSEALTLDGQQINSLLQRRVLSTPADRSVTSPNIDTLYSSAFLDLSAGPVEVSTPEAPTRYHSVAFMNAFTDNIAYLGSRATGGKAGRFWIVGPEWSGDVPAGVTLVRADTNDIWMLGRTLVTGPEDLEAARKVQSGISIDAAPEMGAVSAAIEAPARVPDAPTFLRVVNQMLGRSPTTVGQAKRAASFAACGVRPGNMSAWDNLSPEIQELWNAEMPSAMDSLRRRTRRADLTDGAWRSAPPNVGNFGENDELRARIALSGLAALSAQEATYFVTARDSAGQSLDGRRAYTFTLPPGGVPVEAFWSLTMYAEDENGRFFLAENPIQRYSISDRTSEVQAGEDGSIIIYLQAEMPQGETVGNWLPAPQGPFSLSLRAYLPRPEVLSGEWIPAPVEPTEPK